MNGVRAKLSVMMFLEFFIWGAWLPLIFGYLPSLGFSSEKPPQEIVQLFPQSLAGFVTNYGWLFSEQTFILSAFPIAAIVGMFFSNQFADRNFAAERFLALSHLIGGAAMLGLAWTTQFWPFFGLMLLHCLFYVPTISITNSVAFANLKDAQHEFGPVRVWGTIGWIAAAWPFTFILVDYASVAAANPQGIVEWVGTVLGSGLQGDALKQATRWTYIVAGAASLILALFSLSLPHTPPKKADGGGEGLAWLEATKLLKHPFVLVLWLVTFVDAFVHNSYFMWTGQFLSAGKDVGGVGIPGNWVMPIMSIGQVAEIVTMVVLGAVLKNLGWRWTMVIGILGHAARFATYAYFPQSAAMIIAVQVLHGICYAFFFATVYIFVDEFFPKDARASAQGLFNVMILGIGALVASAVCPYLMQTVFTVNKITDFRNLFLVPCSAAVGAAVLLIVLFHPPRQAAAPAVEPAEA